jgi:hypothetical protein
MCAPPQKQRPGGEDGENIGLAISFGAMFAEGRLAEVCVEDTDPHRGRIAAQPGDETIKSGLPNRGAALVGQRGHGLLEALELGGVVVFDLSTPVEVFGQARLPDGRAPYRVRVCSPAEEMDAGVFSVRAPWGMDALARADTIVVPGLASASRPARPRCGGYTGPGFATRNSCSRRPSIPSSGSPSRSGSAPRRPSEITSRGSSAPARKPYRRTFSRAHRRADRTIRSAKQATSTTSTLSLP